MSSNRPWFKNFPGRYLSSYRIGRMDLEAQGAYVRLRAHMWEGSEDNCSLPLDELALKKILGVTKYKFTKIWGQLMPEGDQIFLIEGGRIVCPELRQLAKDADKRSATGKKAANARWRPKGAGPQKDLYANAMQTQCELEEEEEPPLPPQVGGGESGGPGERRKAAGKGRRGQGESESKYGKYDKP